MYSTHFDYSSTNRARWMQGNVARVLLMFKQYGQNIAYLYGRSAHVWLTSNSATAEERQIAKKQILTMLALQFGAAGALGLPVVGSVASIVGMALSGFGDDDDKFDYEVWLRKKLAATFGKDAGEVLAHGVSRLTPWDMSSRLNQSDLFFRAPPREREGRAAALDWATSLSGPVAGYAINGYLGIGDITKGVANLDRGSFLRGVEELMPAFVRAPVRTLRYELEGGVKTRDGYKQLDLSGAELFGQAFGFGPSRAAEMYEGTTAIRNAETRIKDARQTLIDRHVVAVTEKDAEGRNKAMVEIRTFNQRHPEMRITFDTLNRSRLGRAKHEAGIKDGLYLPRNREFLRKEGDFANM